jgi:hypothetical protein
MVHSSVLQIRNLSVSGLMYSGPTTDLYTSCPTSKVWVIYKKEVEKNSVLKITCNKFLLWKPRVCCDMNIWLFHFSSSEYKASTNRNMGTLLGKPEKHALWTLSCSCSCMTVLNTFELPTPWTPRWRMPGSHHSGLASFQNDNPMGADDEMKEHQGSE